MMSYNDDFIDVLAPGQVAWSNKKLSHQLTNKSYFSCYLLELLVL